MSKQINDDTKVIFVSSGYKKLLLGYEEELEGLSHNLKRKILSCIRK